jgi:lysophospholipase L1-like esterase
MRRFLLLIFLVCAAQAQETQIDWERARTLHQQASRGEKLALDDQKYYAEALRQRARDGGQNRPQQPPPAPPENLVPLTELSVAYQGQDGGLYGGGKNEPSPELAGRARQAAQIQPLDAAGQPANDGRIVLLSIGMSNTTQAFSTFKRLADADPRKAAHTIIVDGAQGGQTAQVWARQDRPWDEAARRITAAGVAPAQVQALWVKQANSRPSAGWPAETDRLRDDLRQLITRAREKYPNVRLIFLSSRTYAGYATTRLNPEPYAYEGAFAMRALIREQSADGPVLLWGPYLWTNGEKGRALDGFKWLKEDTAPDGTHPSRSGQEKVARLLLDFFTANTFAKPWFTQRP